MADVSTTPDFTWTVIKFSTITITFIVLLILLFTIGSLKEIGANFSRYRCNPLLMPFANNFGYDTTENFNYCLNNIFMVKATEVFSPIYKLLGGFTVLLSQIVNVALGIRQLFSNFLLGVNNFVLNVRNKIQSLLLSIRMSFIKLNNLMGRVYGTMYAIIFMGTSAMTAGFNIADNDLVKFLFEFCFAPDTPIQLYDGTIKPISMIKIGDRLKDVDNKPVFVTSTFIFNGHRTPMVNLHNIHVSAEHYVLYKDKLISAVQHPDSKESASVPILYCLNVTGHRFYICDDIFSDYDEHSNITVINTVKNLALEALNGSKQSETSNNYVLGLDPNALIQMKDGTQKQLKFIQLGDEIRYCGKILGIVYEQSDLNIIYKGLIFSNESLLWEQKWLRASSLQKPIHKKHTLIQLITENSSVIEIHTSQGTLYTRDYREVAMPEMEEPYRILFNL
jgi:hypothetical protein